MPLAWVALVFGGILLVAGARGHSLTSEALGAPVPLSDASPSDAPGVQTPSSSDTGGIPGGSLPALTIPGIGGSVIIDGLPVARWIAPAVKYARAHGWGGRVTSGVRSDAQQASACTHVCGNPGGCPNRCAPPGASNHRGTVLPLGAVDVTDPDGFERALQGYVGIRPRRGAVQATDPVHFSFTGR